MHCSRCSSENVKTFQMIYEAGTSQGASDYSGDSSSGSSTHSSQTKLAERCAPPEEPYPSGFFHLLAIVGSPVFMLNFLEGVLPEQAIVFLGSFRGTSGFILFLIISAIAILFAYIIRYLIWSRKLWRRYHMDMLVWENRWICMKCGYDFQE